MFTALGRVITKLCYKMYISEAPQVTIFPLPSFALFLHFLYNLPEPPPSTLIPSLLLQFLLNFQRPLSGCV